MTHADIIHMVREAGIELQTVYNPHRCTERTATCGSQGIEKLEALIKAAQVAERGRCLQIADDCAEAGLHASVTANCIRSLGKP